MDLNDVSRWSDLCSICGKPVRYWHDQMSEEDDLVSTKWHKRCAKDYNTWLYKMTHILRPSDEIYVPRTVRWDSYLDNYYRRQRSLLDEKKRDS